MSKSISNAALVKALEELRTRKIHDRALAFLAMKFKGVGEIGFVEYESARDQREGFFVPFLKVGTKQTNRYYKLFTGDVTPGASGDYAHGSQYSPLRALREAYVRSWIEWQDAETENYNVRFKAGYSQHLANHFFKKSQGKKIPLAALIIYLQARRGQIEDNKTFQQLVEDWKATLHLTPEELTAFFDDTDWNGPDAFSNEALPLNSVNALILEQAVAESDEESAEGAAQAATQSASLYSIDWPHLKEHFKTKLAGLQSAVEQSIAALSSGKHLILLGPPGTGKTQLAEEICQALVAGGLPNYSISTATAEWTTFETIGGYMPVPHEGTELEFVMGIVSESIDHGWWLIVDELNRADIDKAFGELFTVLSGKRVSLPFKDKDGRRYVLAPLHVPVDSEIEHAIRVQPHWRLIGTMNTFDKASLFQLSFAFMRRFAFVEIALPGGNEYQKIMTDTWPDDLPQQAQWRGECLETLKKIFDSSTGALASIDLSVGPAIPIDIIGYLRMRGPQATTKAVLLEALEAYLYPQLEGQDRKHQTILASIADALGLEAAEREKTSLSLANWTGFESGE